MRRIVLAATGAILLLLSQFSPVFAQVPGSIVAWGWNNYGHRRPRSRR